MIIIDIREESELLDEFLETENKETIILNIPMRNIKFYKESIDKLSETQKVYLICRSSNRSNKVKNLYFKNNNNIISVPSGIKSLEEFGKFVPLEDLENVKIKKGLGHYGFQQKMQIFFALVLMSILLMIYFNVSKNIILGVIGAFILAIGLQVITKSCLLSKILH